MSLEASDDSDSDDILEELLKIEEENRRKQTSKRSRYALVASQRELPRLQDLLFYRTLQDGRALV